jgi:hypothetical protein
MKTTTSNFLIEIHANKLIKNGFEILFNKV